MASDLQKLGTFPISFLLIFALFKNFAKIAEKADSEADFSAGY